MWSDSAADQPPGSYRVATGPPAARGATAGALRGPYLVRAPIRRGLSGPPGLSCRIRALTETQRNTYLSRKGPTGPDQP